MLIHHVVDQPFYGFESKHFLFFCIAAAAWSSSRPGWPGAATARTACPRAAAAAIEGLVLFVRDEIAEKEIGHGDGRKFTPLLLSFFFFILVAALFGLMPFSATSTGNIAVTMALAAISFAAQQWGGISKHGVVHHFAGSSPRAPVLAPAHHDPGGDPQHVHQALRPHGAALREHAGRAHGHHRPLLLIPMVAQVSQFLGVAMIPISLGLALFIMILEVLVAFIQAYIFTLLTAIFIGMYVHPAH